MVSDIVLRDLYEGKGQSMQQIADDLHCSFHKVSYWLNKYNIPIRNRSDATYLRRNPNGDPFLFKSPENLEDMKLFGLGIGLYWGEGTKENINSVRLGNTDPELLNYFIKFLEVVFNVRRSNIKFALQLFTDIDVQEALNFWMKKLNIRRSQINKSVVTKSGSLGAYRKKSRYGVLTVMYHNKKLRNLLISLLPM